MSDEREKDEHLRRGDDEDERSEERNGDLPVEPAPPADDPADDEVPPGTKPGAET